MPVRTKKKTRLSRDSWLQYALEVLRREGIQGVRVERLARDLEVTKGSFYWHFHDRDDLLGNIVDFWDGRYTDVVIENPELTAVDPDAGLLKLMTQVRREDLACYELAMRGWADQDKKVRRAVTAVYDKRTKFVRSFFTRLGFRGLDAEVRTRLAMCYLCWEQHMYSEDTETKQLQLIKLQHEILTRK